MSTSALVTGGCACGRIRYELSAKPLFSLNCHCRNCQRASGAAYAGITVVWNDSLTVTKGDVTYYVRDPEDGDTLCRGFCSSCGSPLMMQRPARPKLAYILAGSLDAPEDFEPSMNIFTDEAHPWDAMDAKLETFGGMPPVPDGFGQ